MSEENKNFNCKTFETSKNCVLQFGSANSENIETKRNCKILAISSKWNAAEIISNLTHNEYPKLFFFIIKCDKSKYNDQETIENFQDKLIKFSKSRSLILQLRSGDGYSERTFYKLCNVEKFSEIEINLDEQYPHDFPSLFSSIIRKKLNELVDEIIDKILQSKEDSIISIRYLRTLNLPEEAIQQLVLKCAATSLNVLLAALDVPDDFKDEVIVDENVAKYISELLGKSSNQSVLNVAIMNGNTESINFLLKCCSHLIQKLPLAHQIQISEKLSNKNENGQENFNLLCNLVMHFNFPVPKDIDIQGKKLEKLMEDIKNLHKEINNGKLNSILQFRKDYEDLKIVYNKNNESLLYQAFTYGKLKKKWDIYAELQVNGYRASVGEVFEEPCQDKSNYDKHLSNDDRVAIIKAVKNYSYKNTDSIITYLKRISTIHNKDKYSENELMAHLSKIEQLFQELYYANYPHLSDENSDKIFQYERKLLEVIASSKKLEIIFVFDSEYVKNVDPGTNEKTLGLTYCEYDLIIIGAKYDGSEDRDNIIRGTLSHEMGHYAMHLIYSNSQKPYFESDSLSSEEFKRIISKYENDKKSMKDDFNEKYGIIISSAFNSYSKENWEKELIVRVFELLAHFCKRPDDLKTAYDINSELFNFFVKFVFEKDMEKYNLQDREDVKMLNKLSVYMQSMLKLKYEFSENKVEILEIIPLRSTIVTSNFPNLLILNIYNQLEKIDHKLVDSKNIFISIEDLQSDEIFKMYQGIVNKNLESNIFVIDCSFGEQFYRLKMNKNSKFIFIVKNDEKLKNYLKNIKFNIIKQYEINYGWNDLNPKTQKLILRSTIVIFQSNSDKISLQNLILKNAKSKEANLSKILNTQLLGMIFNKSDIHIGKKFEFCLEFKILYQSKCYIQNLILSDLNSQFSSKHDKGVKIKIITIEESLKEIFSNQFFIILVSDIAGIGKTWSLFELTRILQISENYNDRTTVYIDLKNYITNLNSKIKPVNIAKFIIDNVLVFQEDYNMELFLSHYENGKTNIIVDGYDETTKYSTFVLDLLTSFASNGGNRMWIGTRDYYENELNENLKIDLIFKLEQFDRSEGVIMIRDMWLFYDLHERINKLSIDKLKTEMKNSIKNEEYKKLSTDLIEEIILPNVKSLGYPLFYQVLAKVFYENKEPSVKYTLYEIFVQYVTQQCRRWVNEKGEQANDKSVEGNMNKMTFVQTHQHLAMEDFFPDNEYFIERRDGLWGEEDVILCGLMYKYDGRYYFFHETIKEFLAAFFIVTIILTEKDRVTNQFLKFLSEFLSDKKYTVVRMFLEDVCAKENLLKKFEGNISEISQKFFSQIRNFYYIFSEDLIYLQNVVFKMLNHGNSSDAIRYWSVNIEGMIKSIDECKQFEVNVKNLLESENAEKIKKILCKINKQDQNLLQVAAINNRWYELHHTLWILYEKLDSTVVTSMIYHKDEYGLNLITYVIAYNYPAIVELTWRKIIGYLEGDSNKLLDLVCQSNRIYNKSIIYRCIERQNYDVLDFTWKTVRELYNTNNQQQGFIDLITRRLKFLNTNILNAVARCSDYDNHQIFWKFLEETFNDKKDELRTFIIEKYQNAQSFLYDLILISKPEIIEFTCERIKCILTDMQYIELIQSCDCFGRNLIHLSIEKSSKFEVFQAIWKILKKTFNSDEEFSKFLIRTVRKDTNIKLNNNTEGYNIFHIAIRYSEKECLEFIINELIQMKQETAISKLLKITNDQKETIFHTIADNDKPIKYHEYLLEVFDKYGNSDIFEMMNERDDYQVSVLSNYVFKCQLPILNLIWNMIENKLEKLKDEDLITTLGCSNNIIHACVQSEKSENLRFVWESVENLFKNRSLHDEFRKIVLSKTDVYMYNILSLAAIFLDQEFHEILWELLMNTFRDENITELKKLIEDKVFLKNNNNYIFFITTQVVLDVIIHTFENFKKIYKDEYPKLFEQVNSHGETILHVASKSYFINIPKWILEELISLKLEKSYFKKIILTKNNDQDTFIDILLKQNRKDAFDFNLDAIKDCIGSELYQKIIDLKSSNADISKSLKKWREERNNRVDFS